MITFKAAVASCPKKSGTHNSDNFYFNSKFITEDLTSSQVMLAHKKAQSGIQMYAVTDGNAADAYKDEISLMLVRGLKKFHARMVENPDADALNIIDDYNREAYNAAKKRSATNDKKPSSSLGLMYINGKSLIFSNTGNVRIYRIRKGYAELFSVDHTQAQKMVELGLMTNEKAMTSPQRKKLTQYFGVMPEELSFRPVVFEETARAGDLFVICSCGCYENVSAARMAEISEEYDNAADFVKAVFAEAVSYGVKEDITVLAVKADAADSAVPVGTTGAVVPPVPSRTKSAPVVSANETSVASAKAKSTSSKATDAEADYDEDGMYDDKPVGSLSDSIKAFFGINTSKDGENSEQIWPALLVFLVCLVLVIILTVYGIKIYNKNKAPAPNGDTPYGTFAPTPTPEETEAPPAPTATAPGILDGSATIAPTGGSTTTTAPSQTGTPGVTTAPSTEAPTTEAPATEAPTTDAPATDAPATDAPATDAPATDTPATDAPATDAPATDAPATDAPVTDAPASEEPAQPTDEQSGE